MNLLLAFIAIEDLREFTQAGTMPGRSQPATSSQMKRLEETVEVQRLIQSCSMRLTEEKPPRLGDADGRIPDSQLQKNGFIAEPLAWISGYLSWKK
jgi:hypothetical protein